MRRLTLAVATLTALACAATLAQADSYYGPVKVGNLCFVKQVGNSLGYWAACAPSGGTANASVSRRR